MKFLLFLLTVLTAPLAVILLTLFHGGFSTVTVKEQLKESNVYEKMTEMIKSSTNTDDSKSASAEDDQIFSVIQSFITPEYLELKTEGVLESSALWITGKSKSTPTLSFKEVKDEIISQNPELLSSLTEMSQAAEEDATNAPDTSSQEEKDQMLQQSKMISSFTKNDFTIPLDKTLLGIKKTHDILSVLLPVLLGLIILYLAGILLLAHTWSSRLRWFGMTVLLSSFAGISVSFIINIIFHTALSALIHQENTTVQLIYPVIDRIVSAFVLKYGSYQMMITIGGIVVGVVCLIVSSFIKPNIIPVSKPLPTQKKNKK